MENTVYIPKDVRFSENILWSLDIWGLLWFSLFVGASIMMWSTWVSWFGIYGLAYLAAIDAFVYMYHSEYPGRNPLRMRDVIKPIITYVMNQRLSYKLVDVLDQMSDEEYLSLVPEKIAPVFITNIEPLEEVEL